MLPTHPRISRISLIALLNLAWITPSLIVPNATAEYIKQDVLKPYTGPSVQGVDTSTLNGKVMTGYQGWFNCRGDGAGLGWTHWARNRHKLFGPGNVTVDLWPDTTECFDEELFETGFEYRDGTPAKVFSSHNRMTVVRHFMWMRNYGIDGAFLQRFAHGLDKEASKHHKDVVLSHVREGANRFGRAYGLMYDLTGVPDGKIVETVWEDWQELRSKMKITEDPAYIKHDGKPVITLWGVGFNEDVKDRASISECADLIDLLKKDGCTVMLGVPTGWLEQKRDASEEPELHDMLKKADILTPWSVTRYRTIKDAEAHGEEHWAPDIKWCKENGLDYLPVIYPGFSWHNNKGGEIGSIPRLKGKFLWAQALAAKRAGAEMIYIAMFDEVDEGTAIFKCTDNPPTGNGGKFLDLEGLPSDFYLQLSGKVGALIRGEIPTSDKTANGLIRP